MKKIVFKILPDSVSLARKRAQKELGPNTAKLLEAVSAGEIDQNVATGFYTDINLQHLSARIILGPKQSRTKES